MSQPPERNVDGPPYTQPDPNHKRKTPEAPGGDILEQLDCTKEHLRKLATMLRELPAESDEKSRAFRKLVVSDLWGYMGGFFGAVLLEK